MYTISKKTCKLLFLWVAGALLFQACATYTPKQPVVYPTPTPSPGCPGEAKAGRNLNPNLSSRHRSNQVLSPSTFSRQAQ